MQSLNLSRVCLIVAFIGLQSAPAAQAQSTPDAGALRQQVEREIALPSPRQKGGSLPSREQAPVVAPGGINIHVRAFRFEGNTLFTKQQLENVVRPWTNRTLDYAGLQAVAAAVGGVYRASGWVVRTVLPPQDVTDGEVTVKLIEARLGVVRLEGRESTRLPATKIMGIIQQPLNPGALLNVADLERGLMLADDLPGVIVTGDLREAAVEGHTDVLVQLSDEPLIMGEAAFDNVGSRSTGARRLSSNVDILSPLGLGDLLRSTIIHTDGSDFVHAAYSFPAGVSGLRTGINASALRYRLTAPEFATLNARGRSNTVGLDVSYSIIRSRKMNLIMSGNFDIRSFDNNANGSSTSDYTVRNFTLGVGGNVFDEWGGGGANAASIQLVNSTLDLDGSLNKGADAASTRSAGSSTKLRYSISRQQALGKKLSLYAALTGQWTHKNQDSSEKFYLGGAYGVRAFPNSEGGGATGQLLTLEARAVLPYDVVGTVFYDWGHVRNNVDNQFSGAPAINSYYLKGAGLGLQGRIDNLILKGSWSRRIGGNPNPTLSGNDQDGSHLLNRFWFSATIVF